MDLGKCEICQAFTDLRQFILESGDIQKLCLTCLRNKQIAKLEENQIIEEK